MALSRNRASYLQILASVESNSTYEQILTMAAVLLNAIKSRNKTRIRVENFVETTVLFSLDEFRGHFRMTRTTVEIVYEELAKIVRENNLTRLTEREYKGGKEQCHLREKLLIFLWFLTTKETYREIANLFNIAEGTCCITVHAISETFAKYLVPKVIRWPTMDEKIEISRAIEDSKGFPMVIGMIDGCHIPIQKPRQGGVYYYNRKDFHSIILQAVCREDLRFTDIFVGFPGRVHDARVFDSSPLFQNGLNMCGEYVVLGDSAYPNLRWLLTPFKQYQQLSRNMTRYNTIHSAVRTTIERAFALLKGRFRRLKFVDQHCAETMCNTTAAACCLHNICLLEEDTEDYFERDVEVPVAVLPPGIFDIESRERGILRRNNVMNRLACN